MFTTKFAKYNMLINAEYNTGFVRLPEIIAMSYILTAREF